MSAPQRLTYDDLLTFPGDDGLRRELLDGELVVTPSPVVRHQRAVTRLFRVLDAWTTAHGGETFMAPLDVVLTRHDVVEPDVFVVAADDVVDDDGHVFVVPVLAAEVLSPSTRRLDLVRKRLLYERHGVRTYLVVDPVDRLVLLHEHDGQAYGAASRLGAGDVLRPAALPGLAVPIDELV